MQRNLEPKEIAVVVGVEMQDFAGGDYLNAIDEVTCYFQAQRDIGDDEIATALRMYAKHVEEA